MRISDWSSDVCSSDLRGQGQGREVLRRTASGHAGSASHQLAGQAHRYRARDRLRPGGAGTDLPRLEHLGLRSEEHTSELQSLMRISYAVFCLKKNNNKPKTQPYTTPLNKSH